MIHGESADGVVVFRARLQRLYEAAGNPAYRKLSAHADLEGVRLPVATAGDLLTGKSAPRWTTVEAFVIACVRYAATRRPAVILPDDVVDLELWRRAHEELANARTGEDPPAGQTGIGARRVPAWRLRLG